MKTPNDPKIFLDDLKTNLSLLVNQDTKLEVPGMNSLDDI
jgi:hypothetical protein